MSPLTCPYCQSRPISKRLGTTDLGYGVFRCSACRRKFNERTGTPFNYLEFPTDIVFQVVLCRLRYKLSLRDLAEMLVLCGFTFTHEAVRQWEERFAPLLAEPLRRKRSGKIGRRWYVDETYLKVKGKWCYLYWAIDRNGNLVDSLLSTTRDMTAAQPFFRKALSVAEEAPQQVTTDGHDSYPRAVREVLGTHVEHRDNAYLNRRIEQDHQGIKSAMTRCSALGPSVPHNVSAQPWTKSGNTFVRVADGSSSSPWLVKGSYLSPEYNRSKPVSSPANSFLSR